MASETTNVSIRMDKDLKMKTDIVLKEIGLSFSSAVSMFFRQMIIQGKLPMEVKANPHSISLIEALDEAEEMTKSGLENYPSYNSAQELHAAIMREDSE